MRYGILCSLCRVLKLLAVARFLFVAFDTGYIPVFPSEGELRFVVVEFFCGPKFLGVVAFRAVISERFLVHIFMTINTILPQAQKGFFLFFQLWLDYKIRGVATATINFFAFA